MIHARADIATLRALDADAVVVGAGPLGLVTALRLAQGGRRVLVLESGGRRAARGAQDLAEADLVSAGTHHAPAITVARRLGGTGVLWGGRCVPYDPVDFAARPWLGLRGWPIARADLDPWLGAACAMLGAGPAVFRSAAEGLEIRDDAFGADSLERWSGTPATHRLHARTLRRSRDLHVALGVTVCGFDHGADGRVRALELWRDGARARLPVREVILAGGGNAVTQLLLNAQTAQPGRFGGADGPLGRFYMGHLNGQIADIRLAGDGIERALAFFADGDGHARRRFAPGAALQRARGLANIAFWPIVPPIGAAEHGSGALSAAYLALSLPTLGRRLIPEPIRLKHLGPPPYRRGPHLHNLLTDPVTAATAVPRFLWQRYGARRRMPGFFLTNGAHRYGLEYQGEHLPDPESRLTLSERRDATGARRLRIDLRFGESDAGNVVRAHAALGDWLEAEGLGTLEYRVPAPGREAAVLAAAKHGNHQIGTVRMAARPGDGVVDHRGTCFCTPNLHVVSTAVLPTASQAAPTLTAAQLGLRLADHLMQTGRV